jgi:cytochrome c5
MIMSDPLNSATAATRSPTKGFVFVAAVLAVIAYLAFKFVASGALGGPGSAPMTPEAIADRLKPVATVALGAAASQAPRTGEAVFKSICAACHDVGAAGAPKTGDVGLWAPRIAQGFDTLVKHAMEGFKGMPARGGNPALDPLEVARAVAYLGNRAGAKFKEPETSAAK